MILKKVLASSPTLLLLLVGLASVYRWLIHSHPPLNGYDEQLYLFFVQAFQQHGLEGLRSILHQFPTDEVLSKGPLPLRFFFIFIGWAGCVLSGGIVVQHLALISFVSGIALVAVSFLLFKEWFSKQISFLICLLLVVSPLGTALGERALQDSFFALMVLLCIYFYHLAWTRKKITYLFLFTLSLFFGFLTKETFILFYPAFIVIGFYHFYHQPDFKMGLGVLGALGAAPLFAFCVLLYVVRDWSLLRSTYQHYVYMQSVIPYAVKFQQGPWFRYLVDFMLVSPLTFLFAVVGSVAVLDQEKRGQVFCLIYLLVGLIIFSCLPLLNIRFVFVLDFFIRTLAILGLLFLAKKISWKWMGKGALLAGMLLLLGVDIFQYWQLYPISHVYDPNTAILIDANGFIR